jgi:hypothetical protein
LRRLPQRDGAESTNHGFKFQKRSQLFLRTHNETPSVAAMSMTLAT